MGRPTDQPLIPRSDNIVDVSNIDTTTRMSGVARSYYLAPSDRYPGLSVPGAPSPSYSFLIEHAPSQTKMLFDLGLRVDWRTASSPAIVKWTEASGMKVSVEKDVASILKAGRPDPQEITADIFSHQHFAHTGDPRTFSEKTKIVVGPGYTRALLSGWPEDRRAWGTTSDLYRGREVVEVSFSANGLEHTVLEIGGFRTVDYFGNDSFYLLDTPGHTIAHLSALARTTLSASASADSQNDESTFILLGGGVAHNGALLRLNHLSPLPEALTYISTENIAGTRGQKTYASLHRIYRERDEGLKARSMPFCIATGPHHDVSAAQRSIDILSMFDGMENVFTVLSHNPVVKDFAETFPKSANEWKKKSWRESCQWRFLPGLTGQPDQSADSLRRSKI